MTDAHELTLKQILDAPWTRRIARGVWIVLGFVVPSMLAGIGWLVWGSRDTAMEAKNTAAAALVLVRDVQSTQESSASLTDIRAAEERVWRDRFDAGLTRLNQRVSTEVGEIKTDIGELKGSIGELKGLIIRQNASIIGGNVVAPFPAEFLR